MAGFEKGIQALVKPDNKFDWLHSFYRDISTLSNRPAAIADFLHSLLYVIQGFCLCDKVEIFLSDAVNWCSGSISQGGSEYEFMAHDKDYLREYNETFHRMAGHPSHAIVSDKPFFQFESGGVNFYVFKNVDDQAREQLERVIASEVSRLSEESTFSHVAVMPLIIGTEYIGQVIFKNTETGAHFRENAPRFKELSYFLATSLSNHVTKMALRERVKELTCLYDLNDIAYNPGGPLEEVLHKVLKLLPVAFQYPAICAARLKFDDDVYVTTGFDESCDSISSEIYIREEKRGEVTVCYTEPKPQFYEGPFLKEERNLIDTFAEELSILIERKLSEKEKEQIEEQLRHADRLATIGQLAAGIAHELNEPLSAILGFAQLIKKAGDKPEQMLDDVQKIETASLHAREVIKKLLVFSSQAPLKKGPVKINRIVEEGTFVLKARCEKSDIEMTFDLQKDLPEIIADASQINQVLINLGVNAIQAMPEGGKMKVQTRSEGDNVVLVVEDTGSGMTKEVREKAFMPFFTTKDIREGTGLGLSVVHGIVKAHNGTIKLKSQLGRGTRFAVYFPVDKNDNLDEGSENEEII